MDSVIFKLNQTRDEAARKIQAQIDTPAEHRHEQSEITGLTTALAGKSDTSHTHPNASSSVAGMMSAADKAKLDAMDTNASLRDRATHTGTQLASTISDLSSAVETITDGLGLGGGSDPWSYVVLGSDFTTSLATNTNVTGLAFLPILSKTYEIEICLLVRTATATVGARPGISWPTGLTDAGSIIEAPNSNTALALRAQGATSTQNAASTGLPTTADSYLCRGQALMKTGLLPVGNFQITLASETAGTNVTVRAGSFIKYREI